MIRGIRRHTANDAGERVQVDVGRSQQEPVQLSVRILGSTPISDEDFAAWRDLCRRALFPQPFLDPAAAQYIYGANKTHQARLLAVEAGDVMLALMPYEVEARWGRFPIAVLRNEEPLLGLETPWLEPLLDRDRAIDAFEALFRALRALGLPGVVELERVHREGPFREVLECTAHRLSSPVMEQDSVDWAIQRYEAGRRVVRPESVGAAMPADFISAHSSADTRRRYTRRGRALEAALGAPLVVADHGADPAMVDSFLGLQAAGWKGDRAKGGGVAYRARDADGWFSCMARDLRSQGRLVILTLGTADRTVYMQTAVRAEGRLFALSDAYDESLAVHRPGSLGRIAVVNYLRDHTDTDLFDPCMNPHHTESQRLYAHREARVRIAVGASPMGRRLLGTVIPQIRAARHVVGRARRRAERGLHEDDRKSAPA